jgi:hypothetical protein
MSGNRLNDLSGLFQFYYSRRDMKSEVIFPQGFLVNEEEELSPNFQT